MSGTLTATCYLRLDPHVNRGRVTGFKVGAVTQSRPRTADGPGSRMVKLTVTMPRTAFDALEASLDVPAEFVEAPVALELKPPDPAGAHGARAETSGEDTPVMRWRDQQSTE